DSQHTLHHTLYLHDALPIFLDRRRVLRADRGAPVPLAPARAGLGDRLAPTLAHLHHRAARLSAAAQLSFDDRSFPMFPAITFDRSEEHTSELQSRENLVCRL